MCSLVKLILQCSLCSKRFQVKVEYTVENNFHHTNQLVHKTFRHTSIGKPIHCFCEFQKTASKSFVKQCFIFSTICRQIFFQCRKHTDSALFLFVCLILIGLIGLQSPKIHESCFACRLFVPFFSMYFKVLDMFFGEQNCSRFSFPQSL